MAARILVVGYERMFHLVEEVLREKLPECRDLDLQQVPVERRVLEETFGDTGRRDFRMVVCLDRVALYLKRRVLDLPVIPVKISEVELLDNLKRASYLDEEVVLMNFYRNRAVRKDYQQSLGTRIKQVSFLTAAEAEEILRKLKRQGHRAVVGGNVEGNLASGLGLEPFYLYGHQTVAEAVERHLDLLKRSLYSDESREKQPRYWYISPTLGAARTFASRYSLEDIVGESRPIQEALQLARIFAQSDAPCLITGETGTGKELFAHGIHRASPRRPGPFVPVNCTAFPESLLESELFGYEEGAFTGARKGGKAGFFELANGGTLFLDEIGELSLAFQAKLLRVLQEKEILRLGGNRLIPVNFRLVAATNKDLEQAVAQKQFREDLYYRVAVLQLHLPPLREREDDCWLLFEKFLTDMCRVPSGVLEGCRGQATAMLRSYPWRGNVRELYNVVERLAAIINATPEPVTGDSFLAWLQFALPRSIEPARLEKPSRADIDLARVEQALQEAGGSKSEAARRLGISRTTLWRILQGIK